MKKFLLYFLIISGIVFIILKFIPNLSSQNSYISDFKIPYFSQLKQKVYEISDFLYSKTNNAKDSLSNKIILDTNQNAKIIKSTYLPTVVPTPFENNISPSIPKQVSPDIQKINPNTTPEKVIKIITNPTQATSLPKILSPF